MPATARVKCPSCGGPVVTAATPPFCTDCGSRVSRSCPNCKSPLEPLSRSCGQCGHNPCAGAVDQTSRAVDRTPDTGRGAEVQRAGLQVANRQMIAQLRTDTRDTIPLVAETLRVLVRLNPVNMPLSNFWTLLNTITEDTPPKEIGSIVGQAIGQVDLSNAVAEWDGLRESITDFTREIVLGTVRRLTEAWPSFPDFVPGHPWLANPEREAATAADQVRRALQMYRSDLGGVQEQVQQLRDYYPRYASIMARARVMDHDSGRPAGFFGGFLGADGARVWDDWRVKSDRDFLQAFSSAVERFSNSALRFTRNTESAVNSAAEPILRCLAERDERVCIGLEAAAAKGMNVAHVYKALHDPEQAVSDPALRELFETVFDSLRQHGYPSGSESNMRYVLGLSTNGAAAAPQIGGGHGAW